MSDKKELLAWCYLQLQNSVNDGLYGAVTFYMQNGVVSNVETKVINKPPLALKEKRG